MSWLFCVRRVGNKYVDRTGGVWKMLRDGSPQAVVPSLNHAGYQRVYTGRGASWEFVHRLILEAFGGQRPESKPITRHVNGNPTDNRLENLAWGTFKENAADRRRHGRIPFGEKSNRTKLTARDIRAIRTGAALGTSYRELARAYQISASGVSRIVKRQRWAHIE